MCFFDHSFAHIFFVFQFVAKPMLEFRENMMFFRTVLKSSNYIISRGEKYFFHGTGSNDGIFSGLVCIVSITQLVDLCKSCILIGYASSGLIVIVIE